MKGVAIGLTLEIDDLHQADLVEGTEDKHLYKYMVPLILYNYAL
jgi:hypothetical protein